MNYNKQIINIFSNITEITKKYPERLLDFLNCFNENQYQSKKWLVECLNQYDYHFRLKSQDSIDIAVFGGWYGLTAKLLADNFKIKPVRKLYSYDFDPFCKKMGKIFFPQIEFVEKDVKDVDTNEKSFSIIVNTSCEHMEQHIIDKIIEQAPDKTLFVLQSNNYVEIDQHINCSVDLQDFTNKYKSTLEKVKTYKLNMQKYTRFMVIGVKK